MKLCSLVMMIFLAVLAPAAFPQQEPLTQAQVMELVKAKMETPELVQLVHEHGINFDLTDDYLASLRKAGAEEPVIEALRAARPKVLSKEQVLQLVAGHVPSARAAMLVKQHGIDFLPDEEYLKTLRLAGGDDELIDIVREAGKAVTADLVVTTSPDAAVYLDGALQGKADAQGQLAVKAKLGAHALKISLKGKKDFEQSVTLATREATKIEARLENPPSPVRENPRDRLKYVWIPPGTFMMGCSLGDSECLDPERPAHQVTITRGFWIGQTPVTVGAYKRFAGATGRQTAGAPSFNNGWANENMPIVNVNWDDAQTYCGWIGARLPSEAEWEYAARGGSTEERYGSIDVVAWHRQNSGGQTHDVAQKRANGFGLYDILGNVSEWVNDWYDQNYYQNSPSQDPQGPASGQLRVLRGGSWYNSPDVVRVSIRDRGNPAVGSSSVGFRCAGEAFNP
jgi:formylglycine-generating enzyme required for sulfatase activity